MIHHQNYGDLIYSKFWVKLNNNELFSDVVGKDELRSCCVGKEEIQCDGGRRGGLQTSP